MGPGVINFVGVAATIVSMCAALAVIGVLTFRAITRRRAEVAVPYQHELRLEQLQHSVDAIAIEVERIAEAQRFTAKLLAEQAEGRLPR